MQQIAERGALAVGTFSGQIGNDPEHGKTAVYQLSPNRVYFAVMRRIDQATRARRGIRDSRERVDRVSDSA